MGLLRATVHAVVHRGRHNVTDAVSGIESGSSHSSPLHVLPTWLLVLLALCCLLVAAIASGSTIGFMGLDTIGLEIVANGTNPVDAAAAAAILPVRKQGNLLLCTLLLTNTLATEFLPLVLEALYPGGVFALVTSVLSLIIFSEILPQSVCSRHALQVGAYLIDLVKVLCVIFYPIAAPIAYLLDLMLGQELGTVYDRDGLKGLIDVHARSKYGVLTDDETSIMKGTLDFSLKTVKDAMTRAEDVFMLDLETRLDRATMLEMLRRGHSRIPLYEGDRNDVVCLLLLKQLVLVDVDDELPIRALVSNKKRSHKVRVAPALHCTPSTSLSEVLREFQRGRSHMAIVYNKITGPQEERKVLGIVTIEDLIEELIGNINDETDVYISNESKDPVLVRGPDGKLMRITHSRLPGTRTIVVKEIDVERLKRPLVAALRGQKIVPDWKRTSPTDYGSVSFSSDHLPNVEYWRESSRPATPLPPKAQCDQSMDEDDCAEGRAGKDPKDLLRVRKRQFSLEPVIPDDEAGPSLKWKEWKSGVPDSPDVASASSPKSTCSKSEFSRPTEQTTLDIARFHGTLPESEKEK